MSPDQRLLQLIVDHGRELHVDDDGTWYAFTPGDAREMGGTESPIGVQVKITRNSIGQWVIVDTNTYNR